MDDILDESNEGTVIGYGSVPVHLHMKVQKPGIRCMKDTV